MLRDKDLHDKVLWDLFEYVEAYIRHQIPRFVGSIRK